MKASTKEGLDLYRKMGCPPGGFLRAVLSNDLGGVFRSGDEDNLADLFEIMKYVHWNLPAICHGSPEKVEAWLERHRKARAEKEEGSKTPADLIDEFIRGELGPSEPGSLDALAHLSAARRKVDEKGK